ncbi:hypothetical protein BCR36DRAFT_584532 [Piromyces finnis]|uniref:Uncharacterized protein n=1 Tax=Piromyces finnis TaxID=1754191 RepID=A0A1Y1V692_9FUNG|nr:hypothetical protein BCR36DRAFT_584532 [Piromyces finnis]|eukprot:ORX47822.1 hypothetical protein BCR36DRAFT_584532 [Piromyces finnis]
MSEKENYSTDDMSIIFEKIKKSNALFKDNAISNRNKESSFIDVTSTEINNLLFLVVFGLDKDYTEIIKFFLYTLEHDEETSDAKELNLKDVILLISKEYHETKMNHDTINLYIETLLNGIKGDPHSTSGKYDGSKSLLAKFNLALKLNNKPLIKQIVENYFKNGLFDVNDEDDNGQSPIVVVYESLKNIPPNILVSIKKYKA